MPWGEQAQPLAAELQRLAGLQLGAQNPSRKEAEQALPRLLNETSPNLRNAAQQLASTPFLQWPISIDDPLTFQSLRASLHLPITAELLLAALADSDAHSGSLVLQCAMLAVKCWACVQQFSLSVCCEGLLAWSCKLDA